MTIPYFDHSPEEFRLYDQLFSSYFYHILELESPLRDEQQLRDLLSPDFLIDEEALNERYYYGIPRHVNHFSDEANLGLDRFIVLPCHHPLWQMQLQTYIDEAWQNNDRLASTTPPRVVLHGVQFWSSIDLLAVAPIAKVTWLPDPSRPRLSLAEALQLIAMTRRFFDQKLAPESELELFKTPLCKTLHYRRELHAGDAEFHSLRHYAKHLSFLVIDTKYMTEPVDLLPWMRAAARAKTDIYYDDLAINPVFEPSVDFAKGDAFFQQWGSTKYYFEPFGASIFSLSHNQQIPVQSVIQKHAMMNWVEFRHLPILIFVEFQRVYLLGISHKIAKTGQVEKATMLNFRSRVWYYSMTNDFQDERIWSEAKRVLGLHDVFDAINKQIEDQFQYQLNLILRTLTFAGVFIGMAQIFTSIGFNLHIKNLFFTMFVFPIVIPFTFTWLGSFYFRTTPIHSWFERFRRK